MFRGLASKPVHAVFDEPDSTSDGGALLLKAADRRLGLTERLAACLADGRDPERVAHTMLDLLRQRVFGWALGYPDGNDVARVGHDPMHKLLLGRDPLEGEALASQPTLSRFENGVSAADLYRAADALTCCVLEREKARRKHRGVKRVTIDLDITDDEVHGNQQLSFFHGKYDCHCYLPLLGFVSFDDEAEQHLVAAVLRPGNAPPQRGLVGVLRRLVARVRQRFPQARLRVRLDGGFPCPELFAFLDQAKIEYLVALPKNAVLERLSAPYREAAHQRRGVPEEAAPVFGEERYQAETWDRERRLILKAEVLHHPGRDPKDNTRFVVTSLWRHKPETVYRLYCQRGESENRIKELKRDIAMDRTSCSRFLANQFRLLCAAAAYVLLQELRASLQRTKLARAQVHTLRLALLKIGARIVVSVRRIVVHLARHHAWERPWRRAAVALGGTRR
jgi:hypothetical protein